MYPGMTPQVGIARVVNDAARHLCEGDFDGALTDASIAVDATAGKCYPKRSNNKRCKAFLRDNIALMLLVATSGHLIARKGIRVPYNHPRINLDQKGTAPLEDILYHAVRCSLLHEGGLPGNIKFSAKRAMRFATGSLELPASLIAGLIVSVVCCPQNKRVKFAPNLRLVFGEKALPLRSLRGVGPEPAMEAIREISTRSNSRPDCSGQTAGGPKRSEGRDNSA